MSISEISIEEELVRDFVSFMHCDAGEFPNKCILQAGSLFFGHIDCKLVFFSADISIWCRQSPHYDTDIIGLTE